MGSLCTSSPWIVLPTQSFFAGGARRMDCLMSRHVPLNNVLHVSSGNNPISMCVFVTQRND